MDLKQAYEIFGLSENAAKEEVERRYTLLLKKSRNKQLRGAEDESSESGEPAVDIAQVNSAYKFIMGLEHEKIRADYTQKHYTRFKNEKLDHFIHYYKFHVLIGIVVIVAIIYGINSYIEKREERAALALLPPVDLSVMFFGDYYVEQPDPIKEAFLNAMPDWKRVEVTVTSVPEEAKSEFDIAMQQKSMIALMTEKPDMYILDKSNFIKLLSQGAFYKLDEFEPLLKDALTSGNSLKGKSADDTEEHLYGIDVSSSPLFSNLPIAGSGEKIAVLRMDTKHKDNGVQFIERLLKPQ